MQRCIECAKKHPDRNCVECNNFVPAGPLRRVPSPPVRILLEDEHGKQYPARILVLSTREFGLETEAPIPGRYKIRLQEGLWVEVAGVPFKGKNNVHVFDILYVHRNQETAFRLSKEEYQLLGGSAGELVQEITKRLPAHLQDLVREKLLAEVEKSEIINALKVGKVMKYEGGRFRYLSGQADLALPMEEAEKLMRQAIRQAEHRRELIVSEDGKRVFDLHGVPFDHKSGGLLAFDITEVIEKERKMYRREMQAYREAIAAVTGGRLNLANGEEIERVVSEGTELVKGEVRQTHDIPEARRIIQKFLPSIDRRRWHAIALCLSEALTNALKHAGGGCWQARQAGDTVRVIVRDRGPGIKKSELARATLMQHYSTKNSLGCGFTLMLYYADYLHLNTGPSGTTLAMDFCVVPAIS
ncbi:ATP-binding region ATPase domain protein [Thermosediminibacter oceani DSM 16646]|uniref:ATP-binding region ATPase domain protein n=1 Tax=Thermosediminibacter oceani (strain ATCC BAA-1034 / DSM 16646 / JW/IW-1228P) TaxID=555079 RepID=D9RY64_THEOJ|nr:ATP-binding region ATPase domain protein [Thermosediminibacter oceani DSM 16646]